MEIVESKEIRKVNIDLYFSHTEIDSEINLKDKNVVIVDVLRTSTTMITGLANGAREIIPTESIAAAGMIGRNSEGQSLLCGERYGKLIEGFNLGNSVSEYSEENVKNKILVFNSTNGTPSIIKSKFARNCVILGFVNINAVAGYLKDIAEDFVLLCAGREGRFSLEDTVCAGMLISLVRLNDKGNYYLSDSALGALKLYSVYKKDLFKMMNESEHGRFLSSIGFGEDLKLCSQVDVYDIIPVMKNGVIRTTEAFASDPKLTMKKVTGSGNRKHGSVS